jgi:transcriptional regulator with XRE-family HTH domain
VSQSDDKNDSRERLAKAVVEAREAKGWSDRDLARFAHLSRATVMGVERARETSPAARISVGFALGWAAGSTAAVLDGRDPVVDDDGERDADATDAMLAARGLAGWTPGPDLPEVAPPSGG